MIEEILQPAYIEYLTTARTDRPGKSKAPLVRKPALWKEFGATYCGKTLDYWPRRVFVSSDHHFGHKNIIKFSERPFADLTEMIRRHNSVVNIDDVCIFVGDFAFLPDKEANKVLWRMNGHKVQIIGNHDIHKNRKLKELIFDEIYLCAHMVVDGGDLLFTHYPVHNETIDWVVNVHGHEHVAHQATNTPRHINVNCELHDYYPIPIEQIVNAAKERSNNGWPWTVKS